MHRNRFVPLFALVLLAGSVDTMGANNPTLVLKLPENLSPKSATAVTREMNLTIEGKIDPAARTVTFEKLLPDTPYDLALTMADGTIYQGIDMAWYGLDKSKAGTDPLSEEDIASIDEMIQKTKAFENKKRILIVRGDSQRITVLVELIRDEAFHASGDDIVWRIELWYYKNNYGGLAKVQQVSKVLNRERFKSKAAFDAMVTTFKWTPALGGLRVPKDKGPIEVTLPAEALVVTKEPPTPK